MNKRFRVSCNEGREAGQYALHIEINNVHANLGTLHYDLGGNHVEISLYAMTLAEIHELAELLLDKAYEIKEEK